MINHDDVIKDFYEYFHEPDLGPTISDIIETLIIVITKNINEELIKMYGELNNE